jgi:RNA polymerase sigma-70 factor, ECF subfamily
MAMVSLEAAVRTRYRPARVARPAKEARPSLEDAEVIRRVRAGDTDAFGVLVDRYGARITRLVRGFVRNEEDARDVTQESFLKAFARLDRFDGRSAFYTWLYRISANTAMDHNKKVRRRPAPLPLEAPREDDERPAAAPAAPGPSPVERAMTAELRVRIDRALEGLSPVYREVIVLRELEGLSYDDIARALRVSRGTVESRLFRARERLRARLAPEAGGL